MAKKVCLFLALFILGSDANAATTSEVREVTSVIEKKGIKTGSRLEWRQDKSVYSFDGSALSITMPLPLCTRGSIQVEIIVIDQDLDGDVDHTVYNTAGFHCRGEAGAKTNITPTEAQELYDYALVRFVPFSILLTTK